MLQPKRSVYVLEVLGRTLVIGVSENGMQTLTEINNAEHFQPAEYRTEEELMNSQVSPTFVDYLKENLGIVRPKKQSYPKPKK